MRPYSAYFRSFLMITRKLLLVALYPATALADGDFSVCPQGKSPIAA